jgi:hypothetical protein
MMLIKALWKKVGRAGQPALSGRNASAGREWFLLAPDESSSIFGFSEGRFPR